MGLFKSFKKMLAPIGGAVGFALGGPMGAALGSGIGSLAAGGDVEDALKAGALGYVGGSFAKGIGFGQGAGGGISSLIPSYKGTTMLGYGSPIVSGGGNKALAQAIQSQIATASDPSLLTTDQMSSALGRKFDAAQGIEAAGKSKGFFDDMSFMQKAGLGLAGASLLSGLFDEEEETKTVRPEGPPGQAFGEVVGPLSNTVYSIADPDDMKAYNKELQQIQSPTFRYAHGGDVNLGIQVVGGGSGEHIGGGEVDGPGTGTSDSVPARLSDGEFVLTAKAVRGAGGGDRDLGAARLYDMMSELEATA